MKINVKLTDKATETLRSMIGLNDGILDLNRGLIRLTDKSDVTVLAEKQMIANINYQTYEEFMKDTASTDKTDEDDTAGKTKTTEDGTASTAENAEEEPVQELTAEERNQVIGWDANVGTIVRVSIGQELEHQIILAIDEDNGTRKFTTATLLLKPVRIHGKACVFLKKGVDVLYKNPTYKDMVTVTNEITYGLTVDDFKKGAGGMIVGRVIKMDKLKDLIEYATRRDEPEEGEEVKA